MITSSPRSSSTKRKNNKNKNKNIYIPKEQEKRARKENIPKGCLWMEYRRDYRTWAIPVF
jgi:hypothetical protein